MPNSARTSKMSQRDYKMTLNLMLNQLRSKIRRKCIIFIYFNRTEALPANLKWDTPGSSNFGDKQADKQKIENGPKKEKFSKTYVPINTTFKNFHGLHGFSMK